MTNQTQQILNKQKISFFILVIAVLVVVFVLTHFVFQDLTPPNSSQAPLKIDLPVDTINPQNIWMNRQDDTISRMDSENKLLDQKMQYLEEVILNGKKKNEEIDQEKIELKQMIALLTDDLKAVKEKTDRQVSFQETSTQNDDISMYQSMQPSIPLHSSLDYFSSPEPMMIEERPLRLPIREHVMAENEQRYTDINDVIPAAVSVKALLVSSVDAVCGVYSNSDPIPVKLRLLDDAHLPKGLSIDLKGSLVLASAYGSLSNERVYMRLERLTQVNSKGQAVETEVVGYVSGEDGKFGVQGTVIDRSVKIVKNAAASGFLSGVGQVLQSAVSKHPVDSFNTYSVGTDIAQRGTVNGTSSAFDMLSEYYIRRAEQVQPVLQINAGRIVDITFTHGFKRGDLNTKEKLKKIRCLSRGR